MTRDMIASFSQEKIGDVFEAMGARRWCANLNSQPAIWSVVMCMFEKYLQDAGTSELIQAAVDWGPQPIQLLGPGADVAVLVYRPVEGVAPGDREGLPRERPLVEDRMETEVPGDEPRAVEAEPVHAPPVNPTQANATARVSRYMQSGS